MAALECQRSIEHPAPQIAYGELRRIARGVFAGERHSHTLHPTALVQEAYSKLIDEETVE